MTMEKHLCDYGCGQPAAYLFKNGKWCCKNRWQRCEHSKKLVVTLENIQVKKRSKNTEKQERVKKTECMENIIPKKPEIKLE